MLCAEIQKENRDENFTETNSYFRRSGAVPKPTPGEEAVGKKGIAQQGDYVMNKRKALNEELGREVQKLAEAEKKEQGEQQDQPLIPQGRTQVGTNSITAGNRSGNLAISANAIDALLFGTAGSSTLNNNNVIVLPTQPNDMANDNNNRQSQPTQNWSANGGYAQQKQAATPAPANAEGAGNNLYLNDNIVLQQRVIAEKPAAKSKDAANKPVTTEDALSAALKSEVSKLQPQDLEALQKKMAVADEKMPEVQESAGANDKDEIGRAHV